MIDPISFFLDQPCHLRSSVPAVPFGQLQDLFANHLLDGILLDPVSLGSPVNLGAAASPPLGLIPVEKHRHKVMDRIGQIPLYDNLSRFRGMMNTPQQAPFSSFVYQCGKRGLLRGSWGLRSPASPDENLPSSQPS
jgi:hypothetical protein